LRRMRERWWIAVIEPQSPAAKRNRQRRRTIALPKGLVDAGEQPEQTAVREVREETGLEADLIAKLTDIRYMYVRSWGDRDRVFKVVSFFLLLYRSGHIGEITPDMHKEVRVAEWIPLERAAKTLSYRGEREVALLAQKYLAANPQLLPLPSISSSVHKTETSTGEAID